MSHFSLLGITHSVEDARFGFGGEVGVVVDVRAGDREAGCDVELSGGFAQFREDHQGEEEGGDDVDCDGRSGR